MKIKHIAENAQYNSVLYNILFVRIYVRVDILLTYLCGSGINFVSFCDFGFWECSNKVVFFFFHFIINQENKN